MHFKIGLITLISLVLTACGDAPPPGEVAQDTTSKPAAKTTQTSVSNKYDARSFFMTTSYGAASASGYAFNPDGSKVLLSSDKSGVFNAISFDVADKSSDQLTESKTNAMFALSYFPNDERMPLYL